MTELRVMDVPANRAGLGEGCWLRWPELRMFLVEQDHKALADQIEEQILNGETVTARDVTVRL